MVRVFTRGISALALAVVVLIVASPRAFAAVPRSQADVNQDGAVNVLDLALVSRSFGPRADVNRDGAVNSLDLQAVAQNFGPVNQLRDKYKQPFASSSIWNMPIGFAAQYTLVNFGLSTSYAVVDEDWWVVTSSADPVKEVTNDIATWSGPRCGATQPSGLFTAVPNSLVVPDVVGGSLYNRAAAILQPDGRTIVQLNALARCTSGGPIFGVPHATQDIYGVGIKGGHGGSGLSSIGGSIRLGELLPGGAIKHALAINITCAVYCSPTAGPGGGSGWRWPASTSDCAGTACGYGGSLPGLQMGSLLALPPGLKETTISAPGTSWASGMETDVGRKLFHAFQDYGAYVVDDQRWNGIAYALHVEHGVEHEVSVQYGIAIDGSFVSSSGPSGAYWRDYHRILLNLRLVGNNSAAYPGGGGALRAPLAPPIGN